MSNNSGFAATMYESDPIVAALNKVPGFDPLKLMSRRRNPGAEKDERYLDFRYKKLWFRLAHKKGRIRLNKLSVTEQFAIIEAQVYLELTDANPVSSFTATCTREEGGDKYIESAQIKAMDQALTDAGFGLQFVPAPAGNMGNTAPQTAAGSAASVQMSGTAPKTVQTADTAQNGQAPATAPGAARSVVQKGQQATVQQQATAQQRAMAQQPATQQKPAAVKQQTVLQQAAVSARSAQTTQVQTAQGGQKAVAGPAQIQAGMQKAATVPAPQPADQLPVSAEALPADQLPVAADGQTLPVTSDMAAAMSVLSGKGEPDALPVAPEGTKAGEKAEAMPEELPVAPAVVTATASVVPDTAAIADTAPVASTAPVPVASEGQTAGADKPYTETSPIDQILQFMTLEDAKKVIVPTGTCRGWTLDEVAQRRRPSLRFYLSEGYQGKDNILRAAASLVLDDLEKKAG
ncbi:MAG: hypothetical protein K2K63_07860 [Acetatifactor sp.]|nr:hypothetical protein [Acetatifactor sp.]